LKMDGKGAEARSQKEEMTDESTKNCNKCIHVPVCIVYLEVWGTIGPMESPISMPVNVLTAVAENCELYEEKPEEE